jgi:hypothetical protein
VKQLLDIRLVWQSFFTRKPARQRQIGRGQSDRDRPHHGAIQWPFGPTRPISLLGNIAQVDIRIAECVQCRKLLLLVWELVKKEFGIAADSLPICL